MVKTCKRCRQGFRVKAGGDRYCSDECREMVEAERYLVRQVARMCAFCGELVLSDHKCQVLEEHCQRKEAVRP